MRRPLRLVCMQERDQGPREVKVSRREQLKARQAQEKAELEAQLKKRQAELEAELKKRQAELAAAHEAELAALLDDGGESDEDIKMVGSPRVWGL